MALKTSYTQKIILIIISSFYIPLRTHCADDTDGNSCLVTRSKRNRNQSIPVESPAPTRMHKGPNACSRLPGNGVLLSICFGKIFQITSPGRVVFLVKQLITPTRLYTPYVASASSGIQMYCGSGQSYMMTYYRVQRQREHQLQWHWTITWPAGSTHNQYLSSICWKFVKISFFGSLYLCCY